MSFDKIIIISCNLLFSFLCIHILALFLFVIFTLFAPSSFADFYNRFILFSKCCANFQIFALKQFFNWNRFEIGLFSPRFSQNFAGIAANRKRLSKFFVFCRILEKYLRSFEKICNILLKNKHAGWLAVKLHEITPPTYRRVINTSTNSPAKPWTFFYK